ncbi:LuxR C-terminal-related transcriptional regulator [Fulvivirga lutimaris]|uniref:LuxR C-terminal-related transcriptional regulator n=1 Tax=Fulvivirga lutimaris TaxID=1819566 RepID=UPI001C888CDE|nr:LuxR C-terminal-related transcriptional regulator [Fulvivirga lutimaris]
MKSILLLLLLLLTGPLSYSQENESSIDESLKKAFEAQNPEEGLSYLNKVSSAANSANDSTKLEYFIAKGVAHGQLGNADSSFVFLDQAEQLAKTLTNDLQLIKVFNTKGLVLMGLSKYEEALDIFKQGLAIGEGKDEEQYLVAVRKILGNSGGIFYQLGDFEGAIRNTARALDISRQLNDFSGLAYNNLRLAISYQAIDSLDKCVNHLTQANRLLQDLGDTTTLLYVENTLGMVYDKKQDFNNSLVHYQAGNKLAKAIKNEEEIIHTTLSIGQTYFKLGDLKTAQSIANSVIEQTEANGMANHKQAAYSLLYDISVKRNNWKEALTNRNKSLEIKDSISNADVKSRIAELETKYETEKKEAEISRLSLENDLKTANLAKSRNATIALGVGGTLTIILLIVFFTLRHKKQLAEKEAQELQMDALKKRFMELHASPAELAVALEFKELNNKLNTELTEREFEALKLSLEGKTNTEIADQLFISVSTVKFHLRNTYSKMGVGNRKEAFQLMLKTS